MKKIILHIALCFLSVIACAQVNLSHNVIASWGYDYTGSSFQLSATSGEAVIKTVATGNSSSSVWLTQGFQQPVYSFFALSAATASEKVSCKGKTDGKAIVIISGGLAPYTYNWSNGKTSAVADSLGKGIYTAVVTDANGLTASVTVTVDEEPINCGEVKVFHGITPNGDGFNDTWKILGVTNFTNRSVEIYNRWGNKVWGGEGYDNATVVFKGENLNGIPLPDGTYFYILKMDDITEKGWVEITR